MKNHQSLNIHLQGNIVIGKGKSKFILDPIIAKNLLCYINLTSQQQGLCSSFAEYIAYSEKYKIIDNDDHLLPNDIVILTNNIGFHYAVHLKDNLYISKLADKGIIISPIDYLKNFYCMKVIQVLRPDSLLVSNFI